MASDYFIILKKNAQQPLHETDLVEKHTQLVKEKEQLTKELNRQVSVALKAHN